MISRDVEIANRESGLDLLKVIAMLMVISQHYMDKGGVLGLSGGGLVLHGYLEVL